MTRRVVLVSGAGGFIGRWSVPPLLAAGFDVHAVMGRVPRGPAPAPLAGATLHHADLLDPTTPGTIMSRVRPSHLLHFAWIATPRVYWTSAENPRWLEAGRRLLEGFQAFGGRRVVMAGSCAEYDWSRAGVCDERATPLADDTGSACSPYALNKLAMQRELAAFAAARGLSSAWGRIFFQYGPDEHPDRLVASVIVNLLRGREAACTHGRQIRSFLHVADVGAAFAALLASEVQGAVNVGSGDAVRISQILECVGRQLGRSELVKFGALAAPPGEPPLLVPAIERLAGEVGWRPRFGLEDGIADTIDWWRRTPGAEAGA